MKILERLDRAPGALQIENLTLLCSAGAGRNPTSRQWRESWEAG